MTEAQAIERFKSLGFLVETLVPSFRPHGFAIIDPIRQPDGSIEGPGIPIKQMTYIWAEEDCWVWESKLVVPGPGPRHRFRSINELVEAVQCLYMACRKAEQAEQNAATDGGGITVS